MPKPAATPARRARRGAAKPAPATRGNASSTHRNARVDLALQGGGSHGAFTWGVLDRLLEEPLAADRRHFRNVRRRHECRRAGRRLRRRAAREGARAALDAYWRARRRTRRAFSPLQRTPDGPHVRAAGRSTTRRSSSPLTSLARVFSPYDLNPRGLNPLRHILARSIDFERLASRRSSCSSPPPTCAPAAAASSATPRSRPTCCWPRPACRRCSRRSRSTASPIGMAATAGNPTITPLVRESDAHDTILVQINPVERPGTPRIGARHPQSAERSLLQRRADEGAAHDRAAAPGGRSRARERAQVGATCARTGSPATMLTDLGSSSKLNRRVGLLLRCCATKAARAADGVPRRSIGDDIGKRSTARSRRAAGGGADAMGLARHPGRPRRCSIWLAYRGWSVLLLAPAAALVAAPSRGSRCSPTGPRRSWAARRGFSRSSSRCSCSARCSAS